MQGLRGLWGRKLPYGQELTQFLHAPSEGLESELSAGGHLTWPKEARACSNPPTCSRFLKRSMGYVRVLLMTPAPLPQSRFLKFSEPEKWDGGEK